MEECSVKYIEKECLPDGTVFEGSGQREKSRLLKETGPLAVYSVKSRAELDELELSAAPTEEKTPQVIPSTIWTAGVLYYTYFVGEVMRLFDVADILVTRWAQGKLPVEDERTTTALDRLMKKRDRRICPAERDLLYKRVFNFGEVTPDSYMVINESFPADWNHLMKGVAAYPVDPEREGEEAALAAQAAIFQATYDLQVHLSEVMAGTAYLMAAEVFTLLREASDLLRCEEVVRTFGVPGRGMNSVIEHIAAEEFNQLLPVEMLSMAADAGSQILQEWVAKFQAQTCEGPLLQALLAPAQEWRFANGRLSAL